jgi:predicted kinase
MANKIVPAKPFLLTMYGFPGSGKTYFARQLTEKIQVAHLQADKIRADLFEQPRYDRQENEVVVQLMNYMASELLAAGLSVIYDTSLMRAAQRRAARELARKANAQSLLVWFQLDPESAFARTQKRDRRHADDKYAMPMNRKTFTTITSYMQNPGPGEDYTVVSGKHLFSTQLATVGRRLRELGLITTNGPDTGVAKPQLVNLVPNPAAGRVDMTRRNITIR